MNVTGLVPPTAAYSGVDGDWNIGGWTLFLGGLYIAAWSTYGFETAVCYTAELKNPKTDTFRAIFYSGLLCMVFFFLIPFSFQGVLGTEGMLAAGIVDGTGVGEALGQHGRRRPGRHPDLRDPDDPGAVPGDHDRDGRVVAHAVSGLEGRLAAEVSDAA